MRLLVLFLFPLLSLLAATANQVVSIAYFDQDRVQFKIPEMPRFLKEEGEAEAERGYMLSYERKIFDVLAICSFYGGGNVGKYEKGTDAIYSATLFLSGRFWIMHLPIIHPYIEASLFGPTVLSKNEFDFRSLKSNFLLQNYLAVGAEVGSGSGDRKSVV